MMNLSEGGMEMITYKRVGQDFQMQNDDKSTREELMLLLQVHVGLLKEKDRLIVLKNAINMTDDLYKGVVKSAYQSVKKYKLRDAWYTFTLTNDVDAKGNKILMKQNLLIKKKVPNELLYLDTYLIIYGAALMFKKVAQPNEVQSLFNSLLALYDKKAI